LIANSVHLTLFDLDHTLLNGDTDELWCRFLMDHGVLDRATFEPRNEAMVRDYRSGAVGAEDFCNFYIGTLAGRRADDWLALRTRFIDAQIEPRLWPGAAALVARHRDAGDVLVLTTATNRFLSAPAAALLGIQHLIATQCAVDAAGCFSGRCQGTPNMREGKVLHLHGWLAARAITLADCDSTLYSDSINDLPLLSAVRHAVVVNPDDELRAEAQRRGWPAMMWD
jgi:HAD superfamily hydrolase (TIGR01490 family)